MTITKPKQKRCIVSSCLGCIDLQIGTLLIGYCGIVTSLLFIVLVVSSFTVATGSLFIEQILEQYKAVPHILLITITSFFLLTFSLSFAIYTLLVVGSIKKRPRYLRLFFGIGSSIAFLNIISVIQFFAAADWFSGGLLLPVVLMHTYILFVVRSTYLLLEGAISPRLKASTELSMEPDSLSQV